jgi:hypothetical protein
MSTPGGERGGSTGLPTGTIAPAPAPATIADDRDDDELQPIRAPSSRRFGILLLLTAACWGLALPVFSLLFVNRYTRYETNFVQGLYERKDVAADRAARRAAPATPGTGSRLFVVGGSGALFGIDAELIEAKLGIPTVNYATHAALGGEYVLARAKRAVRPGERVLLCPEYQLFETSGPTYDAFAWDYATSYDKRFLFDAGPARAARALYSIPLADYQEAYNGWGRRRSGRHRIARGPYHLPTLSPNGDIGIVDLRQPLPPVTAHPLQGFRGIAEATHLHDFAAWARANGVSVYFTWPNHCRPDGVFDPAPLAKSWAPLRAGLEALGFTVLDGPADAMFPREWYLDSLYHVDACARRLRTEDLVRRLRPALGLGPAPAEPTGYFVVARGAHRVTPANAFADAPGIRTKYLAPAAVDHPDALSPEGLAELCAGGLPVYYDDPEVERAARERGWAGAEVARTTAPFPEWPSRYADHVFLVAGGGADPGEGVPEDLRAALRDHAAVVAAYGTGRYRHVGRVEVSPDRAAFQAWLTDLTGVPGPDVQIRLQSDAGAAKRCSVALNQIDVAGDGAGPHVVVLDPGAGIVVNAAELTDPAGIAMWRLNRLVKVGT